MVRFSGTSLSTSWKLERKKYLRYHTFLSTCISSTKTNKSHISMTQHALHKKWSFPLRISSVNVTKSADSCGHIY